MHAFLRLQSYGDFFDVARLLERGAVVGYEPVAGGLMGPVKPSKLQVGGPPFKLKAMGTGLNMDFSGDLLDFLRFYLDRDLPVRAIRVPEHLPDLERIKAAHKIMGFYAGTCLSRIAIVKLVELLGGTSEPQIGYGSPDWIEFAKGGHGWLTLWFRPSKEELADMVEQGVRGIINAEAGTEFRDWFVGMSGPYVMPDHGLIRYVPGTAPGAAWEASGEPTGFGETWDRTARHYRLTGFCAGPEGDFEKAKADALEARRYAKAKRGAPPLDMPVRPVRVIPRLGAAEWLHSGWESWIRIDLDGR